MATVDRERESVAAGPAAAAEAASSPTNGEVAHDEEPEKPAARTPRRRAAGQAGSSKPTTTRSEKARAHKSTNGAVLAEVVEGNGAVSAEAVDKLPAETHTALEEAATHEGEPQAAIGEPVFIVIEPRPTPVEPERAVEELPADEPEVTEPPVGDEPMAVEEKTPSVDEEPVAHVEEPLPPPAVPESPADEPQPLAEEAQPLPPRRHPLLTEAQPLPEEPQESPPSPVAKKRFGKVTIIVMTVVSLLIMGISTVPAYYMSSRAETIYGARATIVFDAAEDTSQREIETEMTVLSSRTILEPVARSYGLPIEDLEKAVDVGAQGERDVLQVTVGNRNPEAAQKLAQAIAETYVQSVARSSAGGLEQAKAVIAQRIEELTDRLGVVQVELAGFSGRPADQAVTPEEQQLQGEAQILLQRIGSLQDGLTNLELVRVSQAGARIVTPAHVLEKPLEPQPIRAVALGGIIGLLIVAGMVLVRARFPE